MKIYLIVLLGMVLLPQSSHAAYYRYVATDGQTRHIEAPNSHVALSLAHDIAPHQGVVLERNTSTIRTVSEEANASVDTKDVPEAPSLPAMPLDPYAPRAITPVDAYFKGLLDWNGLMPGDLWRGFTLPWR